MARRSSTDGNRSSTSSHVAQKKIGQGAGFRLPLQQRVASILEAISGSSVVSKLGSSHQRAEEGLPSRQLAPV